jgi:hypothetical protein
MLSSQNDAIWRLLLRSGGASVNVRSTGRGRHVKRYGSDERVTTAPVMLISSQQRTCALTAQAPLTRDVCMYLGLSIVPEMCSVEPESDTEEWERNGDLAETPYFQKHFSIVTSGPCVPSPLHGRPPALDLLPFLCSPRF